MDVRYLATVGDRLDARNIQARLIADRMYQKLAVTMQISENFSLATLGEPVVKLPQGAIIGSLFRRDDARPVTSLTDVEQSRFNDTAGASLIERFWGDYVAIFCAGSDAHVYVIRAPFGQLGCFYRSQDRGVVVASDTDLLFRGERNRPGFDWDAVSWHLGIRDIRFDRTCLAGVSEIHSGDALRIGTCCELSQAWSPWRYTVRSQQFVAEDEAVEAVRAATLSSVAARASSFKRIVLMLSGGLDSSIVAAGLRSAGSEFAALTLITRDESGDERRYAAQASDATGASLHVAMRDVTRIDLGYSAAARLPRPNARAFAQESRRAAIELCRDIGADAVFNGGGGDNVFCSLQSSAPVADLLRLFGPDRRFRQTATDIARLASASLPAVVWDAVRRAWLGKAGAVRPIDPRMLTREAVAACQRAPLHPWLAPDTTTLPGKTAQVRLLAFAQSFAESLNSLDVVPSVAPLLAQPLVEACLRVPSWFWFANGRNRHIARLAFRDRLPPAIIERRSKGSPESFLAEIVERHGATIRGMLLDGLLVANGIVDCASVETALVDPRPIHGTGFLRLLELTDIEAWLASWKARTAQPTVAMA